MFISKSIHTKIAYRAIKEFLTNGNTRNIKNQIVPLILKDRCSCFVTLKTDTNKLRGCIGTIKPAYKNLYLEIINNAISSAFFDNRFDKLKNDELNKILITVEVLYPPELINDVSLLDPIKYGAIISDQHSRRGVLLPDIAEIDTVEEQIRIIKRKAGILQNGLENLNIYRFKTEKFY